MNSTVSKLMYGTSGKSIGGAHFSKSGFRIAFKRAMNKRIGTWREPMSRRLPCGIRMSTMRNGHQFWVAQRQLAAAYVARARAH